MVLEPLARGKLDANSMITHRFALNDINDAFEAADAKSQTGATFVAITIS